MFLVNFQFENFSKKFKIENERLPVFLIKIQLKKWKTW